MSAISREFRRSAVHHLREEYLPRIERSCAVLGEDDLWWRPHASTTSVGNLLLHLQGNVRQWILTTLDGADDVRRREAEFATTEGEPLRSLLASLRETVNAACAVIDDLDDEALLETHDVQVFEDITALACVFHVVEHFSWHTGQIAWIAKLRTGRSLEFYDDDALGGSAEAD